MHHTFLHISFGRHCTTTTFHEELKEATTNSFSLFLNLSAVPKKSTPGKFAYIWHFQPIRINATKFEKREFILKVTFPLPSPSPLLKLALHSIQKNLILFVLLLQPNRDVTRDNSQRRFLAQHSVAMLKQCCNNSKQRRNNVATLCCAKNRRCESYSCNITFKVSRNLPVTVRDSGLFEGLLACPILFGSINNTLNVTVYIEEDGNLSEICHTQWKLLNTANSES